MKKLNYLVIILFAIIVLSCSEQRDNIISPKMENIPTNDLKQPSKYGTINIDGPGGKHFIDLYSDSNKPNGIIFDTTIFLFK